MKYSKFQMKKHGAVLLGIVSAVAVYLFLFSREKIKPPEGYRGNAIHVSDQDESQKYGKRVGGHCYLASTTTMLKSFDPAIEFWQVVIARGNATSFTFYFPKGNTSEIKEGLAGGGTELALKAIKNMGYQPHVRLRTLPVFSQNSWVQMTGRLGGDIKTYRFAPPMDEYKSIIAMGTPLVAAGSPCWQDYNVIEGYTRDRLFAVVPDPNDEGKVDPKMSCPIGLGLQSEVFWATPQDKQMHHAGILADMRLFALEAPEKMLMYANYVEKGSLIVNFEIEKLYLSRLLTVKYLEERGYRELASGYKKSAKLFENLTDIYPKDANKYKDKIVLTIREIARAEKTLAKGWL